MQPSKPNSTDAVCVVKTALNLQTEEPAIEQARIAREDRLRALGFEDRPKPTQPPGP